MLRQFFEALLFVLREDIVIVLSKEYCLIKRLSRLAVVTLNLNFKFLLDSGGIYNLGEIKVM
jgi:hypothetical protein